MFMDCNIIKIGKIKDFDSKYGVGSVVDSDNTYIFTINDIKEPVQAGDVVRFRAEVINNQYKASFIKKVDNDGFDNKIKIIQGKKYNKEEFN